jgi:propanol-preferring alcohol dehydrogenase
MDTTMKAALLVEHGKPLVLRDMAVPSPRPGEVLVKLEACGVCHTDVHTWKGDQSPPGGMPIVLGHEGIGRVVAVGASGGPVAVGARVGVGFVHGTCGYCRECLTGHETHCRDVETTGFAVHGCFAEYAILRETWATPIPEELDAVNAAPLLCGGVAAYSGVRKAALEPGNRVAIFGAGGLGLYAIQAAKLAGATVIAVDLDDRKLAQASAVGADLTVRGDQDPADFIRRLGGADACLNFAPASATWAQMLASAAPRARIVLVGLPNQPLQFMASSIIESGLTVRGSADGTRQELRQLLALARDGKIRGVTKPLPLSAVNDAMMRLAAGEVEGRLVLDMAA